MSESNTEAGLTVFYDEEAGLITFDWDPETHPEYNFLSDLSSEELCKILMDQISSALSDEQSQTPNL